ncbi:MAG TPA: hypothetical protein VET48_01060 [Steroidobacteraceae bacterium]|nr:hypothetical protein [Steroidobacteraceae bacterium]
MTDTEQQIAELKARLDNVFAIDARLKSLDADVRKLKSSGLRDWLQTLGPYVSGVIVLLVGFWIKDSVTLALQREQLDLAYVTQMRDLAKAVDEASTQPAADSNAVWLAMYGKHAINPLVERLESGDVAHLAAERGLILIGSNDPQAACPLLAGLAMDKGHRFTWSTQKTLIKVIGQSGCIKSIPMLAAYKVQLAALGTDEKKLAQFAARFSETKGFDAESVTAISDEIDEALEILKSQVQP